MAASSGILDYGIAKDDDGDLDIGHKLSQYAIDLRDILLGEKPSQYTRKIKQKEQSEEWSRKIKLRHVQNAEKARKMKSEGFTTDEIITELKIDKYILENYLSNSKFDL